METRPILRGDLYYADLEHAVPQSVYGSAQRGARPIVILSNNVGNRYSHTVIGAVLTTASKKELQHTSTSVRTSDSRAIR